jgi:membrane peptidoglycan carboxypeptidase
LNLPFPAAAKTGTTNDFRDNWTLGYTPDLAVGVWVGNSDNTPMQGTTGVTGAAPIWAEFMTGAILQLAGGNPTPFNRPPNIVERTICAISGTEPSASCKATRTELFASDQPPLPATQDLWRDVYLDNFTGLIVNNYCKDFPDHDTAIAVDDPDAQKWLRDSADGRAWADKNGIGSPIQFMPSGECAADSPRPLVALNAPTEGQTVTSERLTIIGRADATKDFDHFTLEYGEGTNPGDWHAIIASSTKPAGTGKLTEWDLASVKNGAVTIRLVVYAHTGGHAEAKVTFQLRKPTPTPEPTHPPEPTATNTPIPPTDTPTMTLLPPTATDTLIPPSATPTDTATLVPPTATSTPEPSLTPT